MTGESKSELRRMAGVVKTLRDQPERGLGLGAPGFSHGEVEPPTDRCVGMPGLWTLNKARR
jgi:hypothetical protein